MQKLAAFLYTSNEKPENEIDYKLQQHQKDIKAT